ncbi:hypothetical protein [Nocardioides convexus]|uniref:hypothetical protein n=1 Tax=Nocardioides convexus TaxID=2712224 RepID=UPI002418A4CD|nr:hypothetical protein [Nocardioides convexus]
MLAQDGADQYVVAESGGDYLIGWYLDQDDRLPDADTVGKALAGAERVEWSDVVGVD